MEPSLRHQLLPPATRRLQHALADAPPVDREKIGELLRDAEQLTAAAV